MKKKGPIIHCACSMQNVPAADDVHQMSSHLVLKLCTQTPLIGSINRTRRHLPIQKTSQKCIKQLKFRRPAIQEPVFSVANTNFEGGDDERGCGDCTFLVK